MFHPVCSSSFIFLQKSVVGVGLELPNRGSLRKNNGWWVHPSVVARVHPRKVRTPRGGMAASASIDTNPEVASTSCRTLTPLNIDAPRRPGQQLFSPFLNLVLTFELLDQPWHRCRPFSSPDTPLDRYRAEGPHLSNARRFSIASGVSSQYRGPVQGLPRECTRSLHGLMQHDDMAIS